MVFGVFLGSAGESFALPECPGSYNANTWTECFGTYTLANGDKYVGEFKDGKKHGQGTFTVGNLGSQGKYAGDKYVGGHKNDKKHGQGTYTHANGDKYVGEYKDGKKHGQGTYTYASGSKYVGKWENGLPNGLGIHTYADGRVEEGMYENGKFKYAQKVTPTVTAKKSPVPPPQPKVDQQKRLELARRTQEALQVLGLYSGKLDGIIGVRTRSAIRGWQRRNGYSATGEISETQLAKLEQEATTRLAEKEAEPKPKKVAKKKPKPTPKSATSGSGFFISRKGHVITNQHVVGDCQKVTVGDNAKKQVTADILETDRRNDLALLKISSLKMASVETKSLIRKLGIKIVPLASDGLLRSEDVDLGEDVLVAGYPYGEIFSDSIKVTKGIVSANKGLGDDSGQFQIDAAVQPGNSGGPIYDENGNIVGVVVAQLNKMKFAKHSGSIPENVNFGIKASTVRQFLTSSGLPTKWSKRSESISTRELAKIAKRQTVMVMCHR